MRIMIGKIANQQFHLLRNLFGPIRKQQSSAALNRAMDRDHPSRAARPENEHPQSLKIDSPILF